MKRADTDLMAIGLILASAVAGAGATLALTASRHDAAPRLPGHAIHEDFHDPDPAVMVRCSQATVIVPGKRVWTTELGESSKGTALGCTNARFVFIRGPGHLSVTRVRAEVPVAPVAEMGKGTWRVHFKMDRRQSPPVPDPALPTTPLADPG